MAEKAWMARYEYGRLTIGQVTVLDRSRKVCLLDRRDAASGYRIKVPECEVFATEAEAAASVSSAVSAHLADLAEDTKRARADLARIALLASPASLRSGEEGGKP